jgi:NADPH:quinone reductase-like Zn-dependent oxidoreductase
VLVKDQATSLYASGFETMRGTWSARFGGPLKPMHKILGTDLAGRVEKVGSNVKRFGPGDDVWGDLALPYGYGTCRGWLSLSRAREDSAQEASYDR